jgi:hypothetical protein
VTHDLFALEPREDRFEHDLVMLTPLLRPHVDGGPIEALCSCHSPHLSPDVDVVEFPHCIGLEFVNHP